MKKTPMQVELELDALLRAAGFCLVDRPEGQSLWKRPGGPTLTHRQAVRIVRSEKAKEFIPEKK